MCVFDRICPCLNRPLTESGVPRVRDAAARALALRCTAGYTEWAVESHHAVAWRRA